jgi:hypothetical protein
MNELSQTGALDVAPNMRTYTTMILCYGLSSKNKGAPIRADELFRTMVNLHKEGNLDEAPSRISYTTLRKAWASSDEPNKKERVAEIEREIVEKFGKDYDRK